MCGNPNMIFFKLSSKKRVWKHDSQRKKTNPKPDKSVERNRVQLDGAWG